MAKIQTVMNFAYEVMLVNLIHLEPSMMTRLIKKFRIATASA